MRTSVRVAALAIRFVANLALILTEKAHADMTTCNSTAARTPDRRFRLSPFDRSRKLQPDVIRRAAPLIDRR